MLWDATDIAIITTQQKIEKKTIYSDTIFSFLFFCSQINCNENEFACDWVIRLANERMNELNCSEYDQRPNYPVQLHSRLSIFTNRIARSEFVFFLFCCVFGETQFRPERHRQIVLNTVWYLHSPQFTSPHMAIWLHNNNKKWKKKMCVAQILQLAINSFAIAIGDFCFCLSLI